MTLFLIKVAIFVPHLSFLCKLDCAMGHLVLRFRAVQYAYQTVQELMRLKISIFSSSVLSSHKTMSKWLYCILLLQLYWRVSSQPVKTALDTPFNDMNFAGLRHWVEDYYGPWEEWLGPPPGTTQEPVPENVPFPCNVSIGRSKTPPTSVNKLKPGDIQLIGTLGDSLTSGAAVFARCFIALFVSNRGITAAGGGDDTWRKWLTVPNILKEFNPNVVGYAVGSSLVTEENSECHVAEIGSMSVDLPYDAQVLVERIQSYPMVGTTWDKAWKFVSMNIGINDFCANICYEPTAEKVIEDHKQNVIETLRILQTNLPKTFVAVISPISSKNLIEAQIGNPSFNCSFTMDFECPCMFGFSFRPHREYYYKIIEGWALAEREVTLMPEFQSEDFAVVWQPILTNSSFPKNKNGIVPIHEFLSIDCLHFRQKTNAWYANGLWNNLLQPVGHKSTSWEPLWKTFLCPTEERPYLATNANSGVYG